MEKTYTKKQLWNAVCSFEEFFGRRYVENPPQFCRNCAKVSSSVEYCECGQESQCEHCLTDSECWKCKECEILCCKDCGGIKGMCEDCYY